MTSKPKNFAAVPDMILLATSGRSLNVTEYCTQVHDTGLAGIESNNSATD